MLSLCRPYFRSILLFEIDQHALPCLLIELLWLILLAMSTLQQTIDVNHPEQNMSRRFIHNKCYSDTSQNDSKSNRYNSKKKLACTVLCDVKAFPWQDSVCETVRMNAEPHKSGKKRKVGGLQQRLARADEAATAESAVHAVLMLLIAKGIMSGVLAHEIAQAAQRDVQGARDGKKKTDLEKLANIIFNKAEISFDLCMTDYGDSPLCLSL